MRFVVDRHLGRLAKWLRTMGYDAFYDVNCRTEDLLRECAKPDTAFVTTAGRHAPVVAAARMFIVPKDQTALQLQSLVCAAQLDAGSGLFTRCVICNVPVQRVDKGVCAGKVPDKIFQQYDQFTRCPACGRIYWEGTHTRRLRVALQNMLMEGGDEF